MIEKSFQTMSNLDLFYLLKELTVLKGARLAKVYGFAPDAPGVFRFRFNTAAGEKNLHIDLKAGMWLTRLLREVLRQPDAFVMKLRKDLSNAILTEVSQINFDRIIALEFSSKVGKRVLFVEFVGDGNLILVGEDGMIIQALESRTYAARKLVGGARYVPPPMVKKSPLEILESDLRELRGAAVSVLFKKVCLSPFYLEEACVRAGIGLEERIENVDEKRRKSLVGVCRKLFEEDFAPRIYRVGGRAVAFAPFELKKMEGVVEELKSFSEALDVYYAEAESGRKPRDESEMGLEKELRDLRGLLLEQVKAIGEFDRVAAEKKRIGDWICANVGLIERVAEEVRALKGEVCVSEVERGLAALSRKIKKVSVVGAELILEIDE